MNWDVEEAQRQMEDQSHHAKELMEKDPKLPFISAYIIAGDLASADRSLQWLRDGKYDFGVCKAFVGSYGRLDFMVRARDAGLATREQLLKDLADEWSGSDPDDTDPRFLDLWIEAWVANGGRYVRQRKGGALPRDRFLQVYRGQDRGAPFGIAWSLDKTVAGKFARGAASREAVRGGVVYRAVVARADILGYMTERGEAEVIVAPNTFIHKPRVTR